MPDWCKDPRFRILYTPDIYPPYQPAFDEFKVFMAIILPEAYPDKFIVGIYAPLNPKVFYY